MNARSALVAALLIFSSAALVMPAEAQSLPRLPSNPVPDCSGLNETLCVIYTALADLVDENFTAIEAVLNTPLGICPPEPNLAQPDPLYAPLCRVADAVEALPGPILVTDLEQDADVDGRTDVLRLNITGLPSTAGCVVVAVPPVPAGTCGQPTAWQHLFLQVDYFYTPTGSGFPVDNIVGDLSDDAIDVWVPGVMLYDPTSGEFIQGASDFRLTNHYNGDANHIGLYTPDGTSNGAGHYGECIVCLKVAGSSLQLAVFAGPDLDADGAVPGMLKPNSGGVSISLTPTGSPNLGYIRVGDALPWAPLFPDGAGTFDELFLRLPSNLDGDANSDVDEILCPGGVPTNPLNPKAHCGNYDGDSKLNGDDDDPFVPFVPFTLKVAPGHPASGEAPFSPVLVCEGTASGALTLSVAANTTITCTTTPSDASTWFTVLTPYKTNADGGSSGGKALTLTDAAGNSASLTVTLLDNAPEAFTIAPKCIAVNGDATKCGADGTFPATDPFPAVFTTYEVEVQVNHTIVEGTQFLDQIQVRGGSTQTYATAPNGNYTVTAHTFNTTANKVLQLRVRDSGGRESPSTTGWQSFTIPLASEIVPNIGPELTASRNYTAQPLGPTDDPTAANVAFEATVRDFGPVNRSSNSVGEPTSGANAIKVTLLYRVAGSTGAFQNKSMTLGGVPGQCGTGSVMEIVGAATGTVTGAPSIILGSTTPANRDGNTANSELFCTTLPWSSGYEYKFNVTDSGGLFVESPVVVLRAKTSQSLPGISGPNCPLGTLDTIDPYDVDGDGVKAECNNQVDLVENLVLYSNPDETNGVGDRYAGTSGTTLHVRGVQANLIPRNTDSLIVRVGDVNGTKRAAEILVVDDYVAGTTTCIYTNSAKINGTSVPKVFVAIANSGKFTPSTSSRHPCGDFLSLTAEAQSALDALNTRLAPLNISLTLVDSDSDGLPNLLRIGTPDLANATCTPPSVTPNAPPAPPTVTQPTCNVPAGATIERPLPAYDPEPPAMTASAGGPYAGQTNVAIAIAASAVNGQGALTCAWTNKTGETGASFGNPSSCSTNVTYTGVGQHNVTVTVTDATGQEATSTALVTVSAPSALTASIGSDRTTAAHDRVAFVASIVGGTPAYTCAWTSNATSGVANFTSTTSCSGTSVNFTTPGAYNVTLTVTDSESATAAAVANVTVTERPLQANAGPDRTGEPGAAIALNGTASNATGTVSCVWSGANATFSNANSCTTTVTYTAEGTHTVRLNVTDGAGRTAHDFVQVEIAEPECFPGEGDFPACLADAAPGPGDLPVDDCNEATGPVFVCSTDPEASPLGVGVMVYVLGISIWL